MLFSTSSSYASNLGGVWQPLYNLMKNAEKHVKTSGMCVLCYGLSPSRDIPVYIYATAGMRVLNKHDQNRIYNAIYFAYLRSDLHFYMRRDMLQTIDGELEALYGWITVNVLVPSFPNFSIRTVGSLPLCGTRVARRSAR